jgi:aspartate aminotransferase
VSLKLSKRLDLLAESTTISLNAKAEAMRKQGVAVYNLTVGELDFATPPSIQRAVAKRLSDNKYTHTLGLIELRTAIAKDVFDFYDMACTPDQVAVTTGAKQALSNIFQILCNAKDEVIIPTPSWVSYEPEVLLAGGVPKFVPLTSRFDLDVEQIRLAISPNTKAILINSPHNPTGSVFSQKSLKAFAKLIDENNLYAVVDDIYGKLLYTDSYVPLSKYLKDKEKLVIINGFSKSHALTGWRIGYMVASTKIIEANNRLQSHITGNPSIISQYAGLEAVARKSITSSFIKTLRRRKDLTESLLKEIPGIAFTSPQGAFYFFIDISKIDKDDVSFAEALLCQCQVAVVPGSAFRAPGYIRISFACDQSVIKKAIQNLKFFISNYNSK